MLLLLIQTEAKYFVVSTGYWVPGRPGPLVWGDLAGKLEEEQDKYLKMFPTKLNVTSRER